MIKQLKKYLIFTLIISLSCLPLCQNSSANTTKWRNEITIDQETIIGPENVIEVNPGARIRLHNGKSKLKIRGTFFVSGTDKKPVTIILPNLVNQLTTRTIDKTTILKTDKNLKELEIYPYSVETEEALDELRAFRYQYAFVWTVLMGICFYLVVNRSSYW